eukprot:TRINITY_DN1996_c0_g1_i3.p1 TRINITY_DN1996_c0_g1~~TRINITY_DN1996_c0_g1_i3.p1  ORF type:complete len:1038 (-),score=359.79 TRINITY_DN1996_c0_g1_i3:65-3178(-)
MAAVSMFSKSPTQIQLEDELMTEIAQVSLRSLPPNPIVHLPNLMNQLQSVSSLASAFQFNLPAPSNASSSPANNLGNIDLSRILSGINANQSGGSAQTRQFTVNDLNLSSFLAPAQSSPSPSATPPPAASSVLRLDRTMFKSIVEEKSKITKDSKCKLLATISKRIQSVKGKSLSQSENKEFKEKFFEDISNSTLQLAKEYLGRDPIELKETNNPKTEFLSLLDAEEKEFLELVLSKFPEDQKDQLLSFAVTTASIDLKNQIVGKNVTLGGHYEAMRRVHYLIQSFPRAIERFAKTVLPKEIKACNNGSGRELENSTILSCYLMLTAIITRADKNAFKYSSLVPPSAVEEYPRKHSHPDFVAIQDHVRKLSDGPLDCVHALLKKIFTTDKEAKEFGLQWIALALQLNDARCGVSISDQLFVETSLFLSSDGFMVNLVDLLLRFCGPFLDLKAGKFKLIQSAYCNVSPRFDWSKQTKLCETPQSSNPAVPSEFNFITEIFFMTYYSMHVGLHTIMERFTEYQKSYGQCLDFWKQRKSLVPEWQKDKEANTMAKNMDFFQEILDGMDTTVRKPEFLLSVLSFAKLCMVWMDHVISEGNAETYFSAMPEWMVRDISEILDFIVRMNSELLFNDPDFVTTSIDWAVNLLNFGSKLVKSSLVRSKLASYLTDLCSLRSHSVYGPKFQYSISSNRQLNNSVVGLLNIYVDVDVVEGLDVDKETNFSKYGTRLGVSRIFNDFWDVPEFKGNFMSLSESPLFLKVIRILLQDSMHHLDDSLGRLMDIRQLELAMQNQEEWAEQDQEIQKERERYYQSQQSTSKGFLSMANSSLDFIIKLTSDGTTKKSFTNPSVLPIFCGFLNHFFDVLCGPKCINLKVKNPEKYKFSPKDLLRKIGLIMTQFIGTQPFTSSLTEDQDFSVEVLSKAQYFITRENLLPPNDMEKLIKFVEHSKSAKEEAKPMETSGKGEEDAMEIVEDETELEAKYVENMKDLIFDSLSMVNVETEKYDKYHYSASLDSSKSASKAKMERLMKEDPVELDSSLVL